MFQLDEARLFLTDRTCMMSFDTISTQILICWKVINGTNDQLSSIGENQPDVRAIHHFFLPYASCSLANNRLNLGIIERY